MENKKTKSWVFWLIAIIIVLMLSFILYLIIDNFSKRNELNKIRTSTTSLSTSKNSSTVSTTEKTTTAIKKDNIKENLSELSLFEVAINNNVIKFPTTKESFVDTGWTWDEKYANKIIDTGYTTTGGRIGKYPGGVVVTVINNSNEQKKIQDCIIDDATFYNPGDNSENVTFIGGLNYDSTEEDVKKTMLNLNYKNAKEKKYDNQSYYDYYMNDDQNNYKNYIEFYFYNGVIKSISIFTSGY